MVGNDDRTVVLNCQFGRRRSTVAMVISVLVMKVQRTTCVSKRVMECSRCSSLLYECFRFVFARAQIRYDKSFHNIPRSKLSTPSEKDSTNSGDSSNASEEVESMGCAKYLQGNFMAVVRLLQVLDEGRVVKQQVGVCIQMLHEERHPYFPDSRWIGRLKTVLLSRTCAITFGPN